MDAMTLLLSLLLIPLWMLCNRERGNPDKLLPNKLYYYAILAIAFGGLYYLYRPVILESAILTVAHFLTTWLCFAPGWGKFFPTRNNYSTATGKPLWLEPEFPPAGWVADWLVGKWDRERSPGFVRKWKSVAMTVRFVLMFVPFKYLPLCFLLDALPALPVTALCMVAVGYIYHAAYRKESDESIDRTGWSELWAGVPFAMAEIAILGVVYYGS